MKTINITDTVSIKENSRFALLAGPCAIESEEMTIQVASELKDICSRLEIPFIFKSSFDKANRTSVTSPRGIGIETKKLKFIAKRWGNRVRDAF